MAFGSFSKKLKEGLKDFADGFKHGFNKTKSIFEKLPVVGKIAEKIPRFDNSNNPFTQYFGNDGYTYFDKNGNPKPKNFFNSMSIIKKFKYDNFSKFFARRGNKILYKTPFKAKQSNFFSNNIATKIFLQQIQLFNIIILSIIK